jgi:signal peptidase I
VDGLIAVMDTNLDAPRKPRWLRTVLIGRHPKRTLARVVVLVAVCFLVRAFILLPIRVEGASMWPTYRDHAINFVNRLAYLHHEPERGDVVAVRTTGLSIMYMKRIIALPGETVAFHRGHAVINGRMLAEPYVNGPCDWEVTPKTLKSDEYLCVGDNRSMPASWHFFFKAPRSRIVGKVLL